MNDVVKQVLYLNKVIEFLVHSNPDNQKLIDFFTNEMNKDEDLQ